MVILVSLTPPSHRITGFDDVTGVVDSDSDLDDDSGMYLLMCVCLFLELK